MLQTDTTAPLPCDISAEAEILEVKKGIKAMNEYETPEVVEVDRAKNAILGAKAAGGPDFSNQSELTHVIDPDTDIDE